jgi:hypothetical protein
MKRFRLSTLLLLVVIAALSFAQVVQARRTAHREAEIQLLLGKQAEQATLRYYLLDKQHKLLMTDLEKRGHSSAVAQIGPGNGK